MGMQGRSGCGNPSAHQTRRLAPVRFGWMLAVVVCLCSACACKTGGAGAQSGEAAFTCENGYDNFVVPGDDGYYLLCQNLISYWDGNLEHQASPICNRPHCAHDALDCPAVVYVGIANKMFYVDGSLYLFGMFPESDSVTGSNGYPLWKVAADGSTKEIAFSTKEMPCQYTIFQDVVYYEFRTEDEEGKNVCSVWKQPLSGGEEEKLWETQLQECGVYRLQPSGGVIYFEESGIDRKVDLKDPSLVFEELEVEENAYTYDAATGKLESVPLVDEKENKRIVMRNVYQGVQYYSYYQKEEEQPWKSGGELWAKVLDEEGEAACLGIYMPYASTVDCAYIYAEWRTEDQKRIGLKVYDFAGDEIFEILLGEDTWSEWIPANEQYVFGYLEKLVDKEQGQVAHSIVVLQRDKIADGTAQMIPLVTVEPN